MQDLVSQGGREREALQVLVGLKVGKTQIHSLGVLTVGMSGSQWCAGQCDL